MKPCNYIPTLMMLLTLTMTLGLSGSSAQSSGSQPTKTRVVKLTEELYLSHDCPDDIDGTHNEWVISNSGVKVTASCTYVAEDK